MLPAGLAAQGARGDVYVADVQGTWAASLGGEHVELRPLTHVKKGSTIRFAGAQESPAARLVLRDAASMARAELLCSRTAPCKAPRPLADVRFMSTARTSSSASLASLYKDTTEAKALQARVRIMGARGDDRELGVAVIPLSDASIDLSEVAARADVSRDRLVARFCSLAKDAPAPEACLESRAVLADDCSLADAACTFAGRAGAYRVDVYERERTMLGTLPVFSGFAAVVPAERSDAARRTRDAALRRLRAEQGGFTSHEQRLLLAATATRVAEGR